MNKFLETNKVIKERISAEKQMQSVAERDAVRQLDRFKKYFEEIIEGLEELNISAKLENLEGKGKIFYTVVIPNEKNDYGIGKDDEALVIEGDHVDNTIKVGVKLCKLIENEYITTVEYDYIKSVDAVSTISDADIETILDDSYAKLIYHILKG